MEEGVNLHEKSHCEIGSREGHLECDILNVLETVGFVVGVSAVGRSPTVSTAQV